MPAQDPDTTEADDFPASKIIYPGTTISGGAVIMQRVFEVKDGLREQAGPHLQPTPGCSLQQAESPKCSAAGLFAPNDQMAAILASGQ
jgi:hypothetical protein